MARQIWFENDQQAQWVPCPSTGLVRHRQRYAVDLAYENGGGDVVASAAWRNVYDLDFPLADASQYNGIEAFARFASGEYDNQLSTTGLENLIHFTDPMYSDVNLFNMVWAAPMLIQNGWPNFGGTTPTFTGASVGNYQRPSRSAIWNVTGTPTAAQGRYFVFAVPPQYSLYLSATGSATGTAQLNVNATAGNTALTLLTSSVAPWSSYTTISGGTTGNRAYVYITRSSSATSTITLQSLMAQILPTGTTPDVGQSHHAGQGSAGLKFSGDDPIPEKYTMTQGHLVGMSGASLVEVEPWL